MIFGGFTPCTLIDYPGEIAAIVFTIECNFRCPYCHNPELVDETVEKVYTEKKILSFLKKRKGLIHALVITGGEPTMHDDLTVFIRKVKKLGFLVKLDTNDTNPVMLSKLIDENMIDYFAMDIKAPLQSYHVTAGRPVDILALEKSIKILMENKIPYEFRTTVIKALLPPDDLKVIAQQIKGAEKYYLQKFIPTKILNPQFKRKTTYSDEEFNSFKEYAQQYVTYCRIR